MEVMFVRAFLPHLDSRMNKYVRALKRKGYESRFIGWIRENEEIEGDEKSLFYRRTALLGGRWRNALSLFGWNFFVIKSLIRSRKRTSVVHAVDLDSALAAYIFCCIFRTPFVFDIYDHYADTRSVGGLPGKLASSIERFLARRADLTLLADECRYHQHLLSPAPHIMVVENVPDFEWPVTPISNLPRTPLKIGYFGVLEPINRGLENLLRACADWDGVELHIAGYGPLEGEVMEYEKRHSNVVYHGALSHERGLRVLLEMHCVVGFYYLTVPNHRYASPNKYYEHLFLGRPLLTTKGTPPGDKVNSALTGWSLEEGEQQIRNWLHGVMYDDVVERGRRARTLWAEYYEDYSLRVLEHEYCGRLMELAKYG